MPVAFAESASALAPAKPKPPPPAKEDQPEPRISIADLPSTLSVLAPPREPRKQALDCGRRRAKPEDILLEVLEQLAELLRHEYHYVYNHNLGVQSGTSVIEDLQVRLQLAITTKGYAHKTPASLKTCRCGSS